MSSSLMFQYFTFSVMLVMIGCAVFLQLSTVHKFTMLALMSAVFVVLIRVVYKDLFNNHDKIHFCWWVLSLCADRCCWMILGLKRGAKIFIQRKVYPSITIILLTTLQQKHSLFWFFWRCTKMFKVWHATFFLVVKHFGI